MMMGGAVGLLEGSISQTACGSSRLPWFLVCCVGTHVSHSPTFDP